MPDNVTSYDHGGSKDVTVSDTRNQTLTMFNADTGDVITRRQVKGKGPQCVTTDTTGNIYMCVHFYMCDVEVLTKDLS